MCTKEFAAPGTPVYADYVAGDCMKRQCGPGGIIQPAVDKLDVPVDFLDPCAQGVCTDNGEGSTAAKGDGVQCGKGATCTAGVCGGCTTDADCLSATSICVEATCTAGVCDYAPKMDSTASDVEVGDCFVAQCDMTGMTGSIRVVPLPDLTACGESTTCAPRGCSKGACVPLPMPGPEVTDPMDMAGDCKTSACNGAGEFVEMVDETDVPKDENTNDCAIQKCVGMTPTVVAKPAGEACTNAAGMPSTCDEAGNCI
ncbi:hypothetical protein [Polyangium aurulentum]|uniref:hypothetical protein n=1 Tax=Polyangium aurulentum TaxID=2567896 RepID=UPI00146C2495|nr:hypothetical protein [Polyangium aurulentum]UQA58999.1 hypothetical protein E8A73_000305 [Polyangium aurulentum]